MDESHKKVTFSISTGTVVKILLIIGVAAMILYLLDIVLIILTAIVIASAIEPAIKWLTRRRIPRVLATLVIYAILIAIVVATFYLIVPSFLDDLAKFMNLLPQKISALSVKTKGIGSDFFSWQTAVQGLSKSESIGQAVQNLTGTFSTASESILATLTAIFGGVVSFLLIVVLSFYFAVQEGSIEEFLRLITPIHHELYVVDLWRRTQHKIGRWIQGQLILAIIIGVLVYIGLRILNVPNPFFLAMISTIFEIIPVFGPFIGSVPGVLVGFLQGGFAYGLIVALMYLIVQQIESNVIYPLVVKKVLDVPPLVVMIALVVGAKLGGFLGILLSVPLAAALTEYMYDVGKKRTVLRTKLLEDSQ
jgi:predicted PurR-regulated permease PerM